MLKWFKKKQKDNLASNKELLAQFHSILEKDLFVLQETMSNKITATLESAQSKQTLILEDIFDSLEEKDSDSNSQSINENKSLCSIILKFNEYMYQMEKQVSSNSNHSTGSWKEQIQLIRQDMKQRMRLVGIDEICEINIKANTQLHQVISTDKTSDITQDTMIKEIIIPGYIFKGNVLQKAKVVIYKMEE